MKKFSEKRLCELSDKNIVIFGAGRWGKDCLRWLTKNQMVVFGFADNDVAKQGEQISEKPVLSPREVRSIESCYIVIAMERFADVERQLAELGISDFGIYFSGIIYESSDIEVLGQTNKEQLTATLRKKRIWLYGTEKIKEDFMYMFQDTLPIAGEMTSMDWGKMEEDELLLVCERPTKDSKVELEKQGIIYNNNFVYAEDLFGLLDDKIFVGMGKIPSVMMQTTVYDEMQNQIICREPFRSISITSGFGVHCCCGDWSESWGDLEHSSLGEIWKSNKAKIFRLSIVNRTYSFCNKYSCIHLKMDAEPAEERVQDVPDVPEVPHNMEVNIDRTCNLYCKSCRNDIYVENGNRMKRIECVKQGIVESGWLDRVSNLTIAGQGEVFASKVYKSLIYDTKCTRKKITIRTNGVLLNEEYLKQLYPIYETIIVCVSIDAASKATYNSLRRNKQTDAWEQLLKNLQTIGAARKENKVHGFSISMVVQQENYLEIPDFVQLGLGVNVDTVTLNPIRNWGTYTKEEFDKVGIYDDKKKVRPEVKTILDAVRSIPKVSMHI